MGLFKRLWFKIDMKLLKIGNYLMYNPKGLFNTLIVGSILVGLVIGFIGYNFLQIALTTNSNYWFGVVVMSVIEVLIIVGFFNLRKYKNMLSGFNQETLIDMVAGDMVNPIIDKIKYGKKK